MNGDEVQLRVPFTTLIKIALAILLAAMIVKLWPIILMLVFAVLIAVMLDPIVVWMEKRGTRRPAGIVAVTIVVFGLLIAFFVLLGPPTTGQVGDLSKRLPQIAQRMTSAFPPLAPLLQSLRSGAMTQWLERGFSVGKFAIEATTAVIFVLVVALYLLLEGRRAFAWLIDFAPKRQRPRFEQTAREIRAVVLAYMRGSVITATICGIYVFAVLSILRVPLALLLALLAFVFDFIPVVGTIVMAVPATLLGLLVSPTRALLVAGAYALYHVIEAYVLIPRIWGREMRVPTLTVLLAIAIGGMLIGPLGAVLALPIAAAYPIVERIWLRGHLPPDTVSKHEELGEQTQT